MAWSDLFLTPLYLAVFYTLAYWIKPYVSDKNTAPYFIPGYTVKIIGALALGMVYQFYYTGGDTYNFYYNSSQIYRAFIDSPLLGFKLLFTQDRFHPELFDYISRMYFFHDKTSLFVIKVGGFFSFFCFNSYTVIACLFATVSYSGLWVLYKTFYGLYPHLFKALAWAVLFIPSVFFWGSGYLKDTLTLAAVGWAVYSVYQVFFRHKGYLFWGTVFVLACYVLYAIKIYIVLCLLPALILWIFLRYTKSVRSTFFRWVLTPLMFALAALAGFYAIQKVGEDNARYSLDSLSHTAEITARWISYVGEQQGGSVYTLGDYDYSAAGMLRKALPAVNVTLFRPYVWEVRNPVMLLSALESLFLLFFTAYVVYRKDLGGFLRAIKKDATVIFCLIFALSFAFAIGISTYNFGSLVRYKIPLLPFYLIALIIVLNPAAKRVYVKRRRKLARLDDTENNASTVVRARLPMA